MQLLKSVLVAAALVLAAPTAAKGGHGHGGKHHGHHHGWQDHRHYSKWKHHRHHRHYPRREVHAHHYYAPYPVYPAYPAYPAYAPAPGVHIVVPNIYIPLR